jgi:hypothetical protein
MVVGQAEETVSNYKHLKQIEWIIGEIEWTTEAEKDIPGVCEQGDKLWGWAEHEWVLNKNAIVVRLSIETADEGTEVLSYQGMIGWDAGEERIVSGGFNSMGSHSTSVWSREGDKWLLEGKGVLGTGEKTTSTLVISNIGAESLTVQTIDRTEGDEALPDSPVIELIRVDGDEDEDDDEDDDDDEDEDDEDDED